jgi:manganese efflux pump family protein
MSFLAIIFLGIGLAMDAFAVSIAGGIVAPKVSFSYALKIALFFAGFQMIMPWFGWCLGESLSQYIAIYDHWIAFALLFAVGGKMIYESLQSKERCKPLNFNKMSVLLFLAIAVSIDAFIAGVSFSILEMNIIPVIITIGIITLLLSLTGVKIGKILGCLVEKYAELAGGIILIVIGLQVLVTHIRG